MGTIVNSIAVVIGGLIGLLLRRGVSEKIEETATKLLGLAVFIIGMQGVFSAMVTVKDTALEANGSLLLIASLVIGGVVGEFIDVDGKLARGGKMIENRFGKEGFAGGFINASLIFCVGAMAILGALNDGLAGDPSILYIKSMLDFIASIILASTLGFGVIFSAVTIFIYQGAITLLSGVMAPLLSPDFLNEICMVGYVIVMTIGINFLKFTSIRTANLLPAIFVPVLWRLAIYAASMVSSLF